MSVVRFFGLLGAAVAAAGSPSTLPEQTEVSFPTKVELVTVDAVVLDSKDTPVSGLTRDDFEVTEDGRSRDIASFEAIAIPRLNAPSEGTRVEPVADNTPAARAERAFTLLVDDLGIVRPMSGFLRHAVASLVEGALGGGDEVTLGTTSGKIWWSARLPEGREDLLKVLDRVEGSFVDPSTRDHMTEYEAFWINTYEVGALDSTGASLTEATANESSILERVSKRYLALGLCGNPERGSLMNCPSLVQGDAAAINLARQDRARRTLLGVRRALQGLSLAHGRTSLILFSPGFLLDNDVKQAEVTTAARDAHTAVYFVDVRGLVTDSGVESASAEPLHSGVPIDPGTSNKRKFEELTLESAGAEALAQDTGGFTVKGTNDIAGGALRIAEESRSFYLLGFVPAPSKSPSDWHKLKVEVKTPGLSVRARKGYTLRSILDKEPLPVKKAEKTDEGGQKKPDKIEPSLMVAAALESAHTSSAIPLRAMTYILEPLPSGATHVMVAVEVNGATLPYETKGDARSAHLEADVAAVNRDSGRGFLHAEPFDVVLHSGDASSWKIFVRDFQLPAGVSQVRVVVRDKNGALGSLTQRFEVPATGTLRVATPILTDRVEPPKDGKGRPTVTLSVHRTFEPQGGLYCQFQVLGAQKDPATGMLRVTAGLEVVSAEGHVLTKIDPSLIAPDSDGRIVRTIGMPLAGLPVGSYDLVLQVQDQVAGSQIDDKEAFRLARATGP